MIISNQRPCFGPGNCEYRTLSREEAEVVARNEEEWYLVSVAPFMGTVQVYRRREGR